MSRTAHNRACTPRSSRRWRKWRKPPITPSPSLGVDAKHVGTGAVVQGGVVQGEVVHGPQARFDPYTGQPIGQLRADPGGDALSHLGSSSADARAACVWVHASSSSARAMAHSNARAARGAPASNNGVTQ